MPSEGNEDPMRNFRIASEGNDGNDKLKIAKKNQWIEADMYFEVMAIDEEFAKSAMEDHVAKLNQIPDAFIESAKFLGTRKIENPMKNIKEAWSQVCNVKFFAKDLDTLTRMIYLYGPSSVEIIGPHDKKISVDEMQKIANSLSSLVHKFAQAGVGGMIIIPNKARDAPNSV